MTAPVTLVTGASSGIGRAFAEHAAERGKPLVLTSRNVERLEEVAGQLRQRFHAQVDVVPCDLASRSARSDLLTTLAARGLEVGTLINNAGFGTIGEVAELDADVLADEVELNVAAVTHLTRALVPAMLAANQGTIINVASTAAFQPMPRMAVYGATKAYVLSFTAALWEELRSTGVRVLAVCPGPTDTAFFANARGDVLGGRRRPEQVVETAFAALDKRRPVVVDGLGNAVMAFGAPRLPLRLVLPVARRAVRPPR